jgi:hypothetical protein
MQIKIIPHARVGAWYSISLWNVRLLKYIYLHRNPTTVGTGLREREGYFMEIKEELLFITMAGGGLALNECRSRFWGEILCFILAILGPANSSNHKTPLLNEQNCIKLESKGF